MVPAMNNTLIKAVAVLLLGLLIRRGLAFYRQVKVEPTPSSSPVSERLH
jgi:hypothetical protein